MATHPIPTPPADEPPLSLEATSLSHEEWWDLFDQLRLSQAKDYAEYGGPVAFFRNERNADSDIA